MADVMLVEDDAAIRTALVRALGERGHVVRSSGTAAAALQDISASRPDVVVLDLGLPDISGLDLLKMLRGISDVPVIVATARDDEALIVTTLDAGADDYVVKPFSAAQLDARIRAVLRRGAADGVPEEPVVVADLELDESAREARLGGQTLELSRKEFDLLLYLAQRVGKVVPKRELLSEVWQLPYGGADKTVDVHLSWLRRKLGETSAEPRFLRTVRGVGVKLVEPEQ